MAKVRNNPVVRGFSGQIGNLVFRQMPDGSTYVSGKQDFSRREFSQAQKDHQSRFKQSSMYAQNAANSHPIYAQIAKERRLSPYNIALSDWHHPPVIHCVERQGLTIRVQASDNVCVAGITIMILDEEGGVREKGEGVRGEDDWWEYVSAAEGKVVVEARDLARNVVRAEK